VQYSKGVTSPSISTLAAVRTEISRSRKLGFSSVVVVCFEASDAKTKLGFSSVVVVCFEASDAKTNLGFSSVVVVCFEASDAKTKLTFTAIRTIICGAHRIEFTKILRRIFIRNSTNSKKQNIS
jgi:hypothetical protein